MPQRSTGSRVYLTIIGLMLALAGGVFFALMWRSFQRARVNGVASHGLTYQV